jgi:ABC-type Zn uptake system ZnuABC Zn-binding protein ZnuA
LEGASVREFSPSVGAATLHKDGSRCARISLLRRALIIILFGLVTGWFPACSKGPQSANTEPKIAATIFPIYDIAKNIVGDGMDVICILPPGASPHTFEPSPRRVRELEGVRLVFSVGHGLDNWTDTLVDMLPNAKKVVVDKEIKLAESSDPEGHEDDESSGEEHHHEGANPHYWLSINNGKQIARNIAAEIILLDPDGEDRYRANLAAYLLELDSAKARISEKIDGLPVKKMIAFHSAWIYYADEFGLAIVGTFEPFPGKQPTPRYLAGLHEKAREHDVKSLFSEPQLSSETVASFVNDIGLELHILDPLGGVEGRDDYVKLLEYNTAVIVKALSNG